MQIRLVLKFLKMSVNNADAKQASFPSPASNHISVKKILSNLMSLVSPTLTRYNQGGSQGDSIIEIYLVCTAAV